MKMWISRGWNMTLRHKYVGVLIFVYRLTWGFLLFRFVDSVVTPVLSRYPDLGTGSNAAALFLIEAEFRLLRTDLADPLLWMLGGMLAIRMMITPLINAGLYYSFHQANMTRDDKSGTRVLAGIRQRWKPIVLLYGIENALILLPAVWLLPEAKSRFFASASPSGWLLEMLPYAAGWLVWGFILHLLFQCMQFAAAGRESIAKGAARALSRSWPLLAVSLSLAGVGLTASAVLSVVTVVWSGLLAVVLHQTFHLIRAWLAIWTAASRYAAWRE